MERGYIKEFRQLDRRKALWKRHRPSLWLLDFIAQSAKRESTPWISAGQCEILGHEDACLTPQEYKTAKRNLEKMGLATFGKRNNVTLATLTDTTYYDINLVSEQGNQQSNQQDELQLTNDITNGKTSLSHTESMIRKRQKTATNQRPNQRKKQDLANSQPTLTNIRSKKKGSQRISPSVKLIELGKIRDELKQYLQTYGNVNSEEQHKWNHEKRQELLMVNQQISELKEG